jgi:hypothetical protein
LSSLGELVHEGMGLASAATGCYCRRHIRPALDRPTSEIH